MGTHPIFESDFDCLTDGFTFIVEEFAAQRAERMPHTSAWPRQCRENDNRQEVFKRRHHRSNANTRVQHQIREHKWLQAECVGYWRAATAASLLVKLFRKHRRS